jgi:predicted nucleic acid-binding protein
MIVADTGPLLRVSELDAPELLAPFAPVVVPELVAVECARLGVKVASGLCEAREIAPPIHALAAVWPEMAAGRIQPAEAEAIGWAVHENADWLLTDDSRARVVADRLGVRVHGTIGLILENARLHKISDLRARELLRALPATSLWMSQPLYEAALRSLADLAQGESSGEAGA